MAAAAGAGAGALRPTHTVDPLSQWHPDPKWGAFRREGMNGEQAVRHSGTGNWNSIISHAPVSGAGVHERRVTINRMTNVMVGTIPVAQVDTVVNTFPGGSNTHDGHCHYFNGQTWVKGVATNGPVTYAEGATIAVLIELDAQNKGTVEFWVQTAALPLGVLAWRHPITGPVHIVFSAYEAGNRATLQYVERKAAPFVRPNTWVAAPQQFRYGEAYVRQLAQRLRGVSWPLNIFVSGVRGAGKTSFMSTIATAMGSSEFARFLTRCAADNSDVTQQVYVHRATEFYDADDAKQPVAAAAAAAAAAPDADAAAGAGAGVGAACKLRLFDMWGLANANDPADLDATRQLYDGHLMHGFKKSMMQQTPADRDANCFYRKQPTVADRVHAAVLVMNGAALAANPQQTCDSYKALYKLCVEKTGDNPVIVITRADELEPDLKVKPENVYDWSRGQDMRTTVTAQLGCRPENVHVLGLYAGSVSRNGFVEAAALYAFAQAVDAARQTYVQMSEDAKNAVIEKQQKAERELQLHLQIERNVRAEYDCKLADVERQLAALRPAQPQAQAQPPAVAPAAAGAGAGAAAAPFVGAHNPDWSAPSVLNVAHVQPWSG